MEAEFMAGRSVGLRLLSALVDAFLEARHPGVRPPRAGDYVVRTGGRYPMAAGEVHVSRSLKRGVRATVFDEWPDPEHHGPSALATIAASIGAKVAELHHRSHDICTMLSEVRAAARHEIAGARRRGSGIRLVGVTLAPVETGSRDLPQAVIEHQPTGSGSQAATLRFHTDRADDVTSRTIMVRSTGAACGQGEAVEKRRSA